MLCICTVGSDLEDVNVTNLLKLWANDKVWRQNQRKSQRARSEKWKTQPSKIIDSEQNF